MLLLHGHGGGRSADDQSVSQSRRVGVHVNVFPVPSEAFVGEQARSLRRFSPTLLVRRRSRPVTEFECLAIEAEGRGRWKRLAFAALPGAWAWGGVERLRGLDLIHAHFGPNGVYALPVAESLGIPLVTTFHGFDATVTRSELLRNGGVFGIRYLMGQSRLKRDGKRFIAVSRFIAARLLAMGFPENRIRQHYIGVDPTRFSPAPPSERTLDVVSVARLVEAKGISVLIRAFGKVAGQVPESRLRLIGEGPDRASFETLVSELGLVDRVVFEGTMSHADVASVVRRSAVSALVSQTGRNGWQEAFGLASIEASAAALPVIVSRHGGLPETVEEGRSGLIVGEGKVDELADALLTLLRDSSLCARMGQAGRQRVLESFDLNTQTAKLEDIYVEAMS
jgi:colanic acid/amylovoran biosynthesis glycosyltransferase